MRYSGIQPQYFPRLHYFARILHTEIFVFRDDVQFVRSHKYPDGKIGKSYQAHTPIKHANGLHLLSIPTKHAGLLPIQDAPISYDEKWVTVHLKTLHATYAKSLNFSQLFPEIEAILQTDFSSLGELNIVTTLWGFLHLLGEKSITKQKLSLPFLKQKLQEQKKFTIRDIKKGSEIEMLKKSNLPPNEKVIALCKELGAHENYCGGTALAAYMNVALFKKNNIAVTTQEWICQEYAQCFMKQQNFIPNLSIIDLLMNVSANKAADILWR